MQGSTARTMSLSHMPACLLSFSSCRPLGIVESSVLGSRSANEWTAQFLTSPKETGKLADFFPLSSRSYTKSAAPFIEVSPPDVTVLEDRSESVVRSLLLRLRSPREAPYMSIQLDSETRILEAAVNGKQISGDKQTAGNDAKERWGLRYFVFRITVSNYSCGLLQASR
jgi:hypothetical protein